MPGIMKELSAINYMRLSRAMAILEPMLFGELCEGENPPADRSTPCCGGNFLWIAQQSIVGDFQSQFRASQVPKLAHGESPSEEKIEIAKQDMAAVMSEPPEAAEGGTEDAEGGNEDDDEEPETYLPSMAVPRRLDTVQPSKVSCR